MRLAAYNVENLFARPRAMNQATWAEGRATLEQYSKLSELLGETNYTAARKRAMLDLLEKLGLSKRDESRYVILRRSRGSLLKRPRSGPMQITADGRNDWIGSLELKLEQIRERPILNTARVISQRAPDVLAVVESDTRPSLKMFNDDILPRVGSHSFKHVMLIDGNDPRGIDVGLMTTSGFPIGFMKSHVDDLNDRGRPVFSRDCPEFEVTTPSGNVVLVLVNHLKSKGYGTPASSDARRKSQASRIAEIYKQRTRTYDYIAVVGDMNDYPASKPMKPLLAQTNLTDLSSHPSYDDGGYPGTYGSCTNIKKKIDYILLSPKLFRTVQAAGVDRQGMWPGVRPKKWDKLRELATPNDVASDHALLWVDVDV